MADITYSDVQSLAELAVTNRYKVDFTNFTGSLAKYSSMSSLLNRRVTNCNPPGTALTKVSAVVHTHTFNQPGIPKQGDSFSLTFVETGDGIITEFCQDLINAVRPDWRTNILDDIDQSFFNIRISMYRRDGVEVLNVWKLYKCFCTSNNLNSPNLNGSVETSPYNITLNFTCNGFDEGKDL